MDKNIINICPECGSEEATHWIESAEGGDMCEFELTWACSCYDCGKTSYVKAWYHHEPDSAELVIA